MKRSKSIRLAALGSLSLALTACDSGKRPMKTVSETRQYENLEACTKSGLATDVCIDAYTAAYELHRNRAPSYDSYADCEADYDVGMCTERSNNGRIMPVSSGFAVTTQREVPADEPATSSGGGSGGGGGGHGAGGFWRWLSYGDDGPRYYSEPLYRERVGIDQSRLVSLNQQLSEGKTFPKAKNGRFKVSSPESFSTSVKLSGAEPIRVSRGGFGARGGSGG